MVHDLRFRSADCIDPRFHEAFAGIGREIKEAKASREELMQEHCGICS